jgi:hypothetical protein
LRHNTGPVDNHAHKYERDYDEGNDEDPSLIEPITAVRRPKIFVRIWH